MINTLIQIGNSDDKLTQARWSAFVNAVRAIIREGAELGQWQIHGEWFSLPDQPWQNANWCVQITPEEPPVRGGWTYEAISHELRRRLRLEARLYDQDSIAWTEGEVRFLPGLDS